MHVLSLSGGGIRGTYTASVLARLEDLLAEASKKNECRISDHFDLITGTSIGGILALGLAFGMSASELKQLLRDSGQKIFPPSARWWQIKKLVAPLYSPDPLRKVLESIFGDATLGDLRMPVAIPAINYSTGLPKVFKTPHHRELLADHTTSLVDVALATSAAPTYFPLHEIGESWYVDGGLAANSPALVGYIEAIKYLGAKNVKLLSVGTMGAGISADHRKHVRKGYLRGWGLLGRDLIDLTLSANEELHRFMAQILMRNERDLFMSIDKTPTKNASDVLALDNASDAALKSLITSGDEHAIACFKDVERAGFFKKRKRPEIRFHYGNNASKHEEE